MKWLFILCLTTLNNSYAAPAPAPPPVEKRTISCDLVNSLDYPTRILFQYLFFETPTVEEALKQSIKENKPAAVWGRLWFGNRFGDVQLPMLAHTFGHELHMYEIAPIVFRYEPSFGGAKDYTLNFKYDAYNEPIMTVTLEGPGVSAKGSCHVRVKLP